MKKVLYTLCMFIFPLISQAQSYNLSGVWNGQSVQRDGKVCPFTLNLQLTDSCGPVYRVYQYEYDSSLTKVVYTMRQSGNMLIRDAIDYWHDEDSSDAAHLRMFFDGQNILKGNRVAWFPKQSDVISLKHVGVVKKDLECSENIEFDPCKNMYSVSVVNDTVVLQFPALVYIEIDDDQTEDSDSTTVFVGTTKILSDIPLYKNASYRFPMKIDSDTTITWCACNQGKSGLNTGVISIFNIDGILLKEIPIHLRTGERTTVFIQVKQEDSVQFIEK